ncbi:hypothetical protein GCM10020366_11290 [Saccharopolyspora gregorii]|uniref:Uncharacterized protein n=1 Tax=Saccharopolyspora gregorii TaxID=33914 RepID=A0ABP6RKU2_9PSEU
MKQTAASKVVGIEASTYLTDGKFGQALSLSGDGVFAESAFRGMGENTPEVLLRGLGIGRIVNLRFSPPIVHGDERSGQAMAGECFRFW